jgi:hypothetical protein
MTINMYFFFFQKGKGDGRAFLPSLGEEAVQQTIRRFGLSILHNQPWQTVGRRLSPFTCYEFGR